MKILKNPESRFTLIKFNQMLTFLPNFHTNPFPFIPYNPTCSNIQCRAKKSEANEILI